MRDDHSREPAPLADADASSSQVPVAVPVGRPAPRGVAGFACRVLQVLRFYSRLPLPELPFEATPHAAPDMATAPAAIAVAGAVLGALASLVLLIGWLAGLPPLLVAILAIGVFAVMTGAMHEDGLADSTDGLWGGPTRERRLEIMRDSRVGSYGVVALVLALGIRAVSVGALIEQLGVAAAALAIIAVASVSRAAGLFPLALLSPARADGAAAAVSAPTPTAMLSGALCSGAIALVLLAPAGMLGAAAAGLIAAFAAAFSVARIAQAKIGGYTGDIAGAAQQAAEIAMLLAVVAVMA